MILKKLQLFLRKKTEMNNKHFALWNIELISIWLRRIWADYTHLPLNPGFLYKILTDHKVGQLLGVSEILTIYTLDFSDEDIPF